jgi:hypothetical protein
LGIHYEFVIFAATEAALLEAGCGPSPWHPEFNTVLQVITKTCTSAIMSFMAQNCIDFHHNIRIDGHSHKYSFLMANFIKQGASSPELTSMIQCRNFLRVSRMSEVATGFGSLILPMMYNGEEPESDATNQWPLQPIPPKVAWMITCLNLCCPFL